MATKLYDAIVVGTGAGGSTAMKLLCEAGLQVCALNSGPRMDPEKDYRGRRHVYGLKYRGYGNPLRLKRKAYQEPYSVEESEYSDGRNWGVQVGNYPKKYVTNKWAQTHDVPNLYICDSSIFPSGADKTTTMPVIAFTMRTCDHMLNNFKKDVPNAHENENDVGASRLEWSTTSRISD